MNNFKATFIRIIKICIIFYLFAGVTELYSQDKKLTISKPVLVKSSAEGNIYKESDNASVVTLSKKVVHTKTQTAKTAQTAKMAADTQPPSIICPPNKQLQCGTLVPNYLSELVVTDDSGGDIYLTQSTAGTKFYDGMTIVFTAEDETGNQSSCSITISATSPDVTPPTFTCPTGLTLNIGDKLPNYAEDPMLNLDDDCSSNVSYVMTPAAGTDFYDGIPVKIKYTDSAGNSATCNFTVSAIDTAPPTITCPTSAELYADSTLPNYVSFLTAVSDDVTDGFDLTFTQTPPQGTLFTQDTDVTISVKDKTGKSNSCTFKVKLKTTTQTIDCKTNIFNVDNIDGINGFKIFGEKTTREAGFSVNSAGDVNNDGIDDFIIGAPDNYNPWYGPAKIYKIIHGAAFVVFGRASGFPPNIDLGLLNGTNGFIVRNDTPTTNFPKTGYDVSSAGDVNGDGIDDFMISDPTRHSPSTTSTFYNQELGHTYVIFGKSSGFTPEFNLSSLDGTNGFVLIGNANFENAGESIAPLGDINGDGYDDIAIITRGSGSVNGKCYVIYGKNGNFPAAIKVADINGTNGFVIHGDATAGKIGQKVAALGDVNGDGIPDIGLGSYYSSQYKKFVIFGRNTNFPASFSVSQLNGTNGFVIENSETNLSSHLGVAKAGDINNDGFNDIAITKDYILFGKSTFSPLVDLKDLDGTNGFKILNGGYGESFGYGGDFNDDGIDDYVFNGSANSTYLLFGKGNWGATADLFTLPKNEFLRIQRPYGDDSSVNFAGDINKDGISDLIIGNSFNSSHTSLKVNRNPGSAYVLYGKKIADTEKPVIANCPTEKVLGIGDPIPDYKTIVTITDNCDIKPVFTQTPAAGIIYTGAESEIKLTATDASGNEAVCTFNLIIAADEPPVMECPVNQELYANSMLPNYVHFLKTITDDTTQLNKLTFTQTPAAGTLFTSDTDVTITVKDKAGNTTSCTFTVKLKTGGFDIDCKTTTIDINQLNGTNGFTILGEEPGTRTGFSTTRIGDVNGDGITDFIIGAPGDWGFGRAYVVFGTKTGFPASLNVANLNGLNGFKIIDSDLTPPRRTGFDVNDAGDINGDGINDLMLSDPNKYTEGIFHAGRVYIIYGRATAFPAQFDVATLNGSNGFTILGKTKDEVLGYGIANVGDFNNDSFDDIGIVSHNEGSGSIKKCYILFGRSTNFPSIVDIESINSSNSFIVEGDIGKNLAGIGDVNGDGISDVAISGDNEFRYVVYGSASLPAKINTTGLNGSNGFKIQNSTSPLKTSYYFEVRSAGDLNGDSFNDIGINNFVLFGKSATPAVVDLKDLDGTNGFKMNGSEFEYLHSYNSFGDFNNDGFDDYLLPYQFSKIYVIYGKANWNPLLDIFSLNSSEALVINTPYTSKYSLSYLGDVNGDAIDDIAIGATKTVYNWVPNGDTGRVQVIFGKKVEDNEKPSIANCPTNQTMVSGDLIPDYKTTITVTDNCDSAPVVVQTPAAGTIYAGGTQEIKITATDASGNEAVCSFNIIDNPDTEKPVITCLSDQVVVCGTTVIPDYTSQVTVTDNMDANPTLTQSPIAGTAFINGMEITLTATDASNNANSCTFKINKEADVTAPTLTCIGNQLVASGAVLPDYVSQIVVLDNCDASPIITQSPVAGTAVTDGMTLVFTAKDASENENSCSIIVNIEVIPDTEKPVITCLSDQVVVCGTTVIPDYTSQVTVTDNMDANPTLTQSPIAGTAFINGMEITLTATDASNNANSCTFKINKEADVTAPTLTCIGNQLVASGAVLPDYVSQIVVSDNCDASPIITQSPVAGTAVTDGMTVVFTAKDASENENSCSIIVNIETIPDTEKPVITCLSDQVVVCGTTVIPDYTSQVTVTDNMDANPTLTQSPIAGTAFINGMEITLTATDASNNANSCTFKINKEADVTAPTLTCIGNQLVASGAVLPDYVSQIVVSDNCDASPIITQSPVAGTAVTDGMTLVFTAKDASENENSCSIIVNIEVIPDTEKPVITCLSDQVVVCGTTVIPDYTSQVTVTDNMDANPTLTQSPIAGTAFINGMEITLTAKDASSNESTCVFKVDSNIILVDAGKDAEIKQGEVIQLEAIALEEGAFKWSPAEGVNNALVSNPIFSPEVTTTYTVTFTNKGGCEVSDSVVILVAPNEKDETKYGFSPNSDGINDFWLIDGIADYPENEVMIYNSWGDLVFQISGYNNTTNVFNGIANRKRKLGADELPEGTYFFEINPNSPTHHFKKLKGYLVLKR
ncbi:HYR domain-containing protein [Flavobacterium adhaerens]|uniref:HYR domain-containing protein n=1 Tax=Flavobacterium adhaerens TaxID=3149043 RepID=UPI0032B4E3F6